MSDKRQMPPGASGGQSKNAPCSAPSVQHSTTEADLPQVTIGNPDRGDEVAGLQSDQEGKNPSSSLTLEEYARSKQLPQEFLKQLGLKTLNSNGGPMLREPYFDEEGREVATRYHLSLNGQGLRFRWQKGSKVHPYGLWKLTEAREAGYIVLVQGESNAQTLWHYAMPALGIPRNTAWKTEWTQFIDGLEVCIWQEPDTSGAEFVEHIGETLPEARVLVPPDGRKDISGCHILGDDVPALVQELMARAASYKAIQAEAQSRAATEAEVKAAKLLSCPDILSRFGGLCQELGLVGEERNAKLMFLAVTSRLLDRPISVCIKGPSSGGKSFVVQTVLSAFPESAFYALSSMSERALAYSKEPLRHRMLVIYEASGLSSDFGTYLLRTLLSEGHIRYETVEKTKDGLVPKLIERDGPTGLILTTTWTNLHPENETRMLSLTIRDDPTQTKAIMHTLANQASGGEVAQPDLTAWHALQTWLELAGERRVVIPYAGELAELANPSAVRLRRDFGAVLNLIQAHAILHQRHRERDGSYVVATLDDYRVVHSLTSDLVSEGAKATVRSTERETVEVVLNLHASNEKPVTVAQVARHLGLDKSAALRRVRVAVKDGYLVNLEEGKGRPYKLVPGDPLPEQRPVLPDPETLKKQWRKGGDYPSETTATVQPYSSCPDDGDLWEGRL